MNELLRRLLFLPEQASDAAFEIDALHYVVISATMLGSIGVGILALVYFLRWRRRGKAKPTPHIVATVRQELVLIGSLLALFLAFWFVGFRQYVSLRQPPNDAMVVYVTAKQWMWKFAYPDGRASMDVLTVPNGRAIKLVMISRDVIHSFFVPAFRQKQDVLPGQYITTWFRPILPGTYPILCAEYCGTSHSRMRGTVLVLSPEDYESWLAREKQRAVAEGVTAVAPESDLVSIGRNVAAKRACLSCHTLDGQPHIGPTWVGLFESKVTLEGGRTVIADEAYLTRSMMDPARDVVAGFKNVMPVYRGRLDEPEVAALVELIRALRDAPVAPSVVLPQVKQVEP